MENLELFKIETSLRDTLEATRLAHDLQLSFEMEWSNVFTFKSENHFFTFMDELEMRNLEFEV
jgi:hypothetical protein